MNIPRLAKYAVGVTVAVAMLAACSSGGSSSFGPLAAPSGHLAGVTELSHLRDAALTMPNFATRPVHPDRGRSFMLPDAKKKGGALLYVGDDFYGDVYVYQFPSGKLAGTLTGFTDPQGMCIDKKGDVYVADYYDHYAAGHVVEFRHGGTNPINTYDAGYPIGCSVSARGDVAVTSNPGGVTVYAGGNPSKGTTYTGPCTQQWTMGYDAAGDLIGVGEDDTGAVIACALMAGSKSETTLSGCCSGPITIDYPGGTAWDGSEIALGDQDAGGTYVPGVWPSTISGGSLRSSGEVTFSDSCLSTDYISDPNPFFVGTGKGKERNITPSSTKQAVEMVGPNVFCAYDLGFAKVDYWKYPAGGPPFRSLNLPSRELPGGAAVSN